MFSYWFRQVGFQNPATPVAEGIIDLHDYIMFYVIIISIFVFWVYFDMFIQNIEVFNFHKGFRYVTGSYLWNMRLSYFTFSSFSLRRLYLYLNRVNHATNLEVIWTLVPSLILITIAVPSLSLLYSMDELLYPKLTLKVNGYQWYWVYEYSDVYVYNFFLSSLFKNKSELNLTYSDMLSKAYSEKSKFSDLFIESYMVPSTDLVPSEHHRLLSTDNSIVLPVETHIRILVTGADVLHSWAVPAFGIKIDAVPGRLNQVGLYIKRQGVFYGQCSELCGVNHAFMPIVVKSVSEYDFKNWVEESMFSRFLI